MKQVELITALTSTVIQRYRKRIDESFGWAETIGGAAKLMLWGLAKTDGFFTFQIVACNLVSVSRLFANAARPVHPRHLKLPASAVQHGRNAKFDALQNNNTRFSGWLGVSQRTASGRSPAECYILSLRQAQYDCVVLSR